MTVRPDYNYDIADSRDTGSLNASLQDRRRLANSKKIILPNRNLQVPHPQQGDFTVTWNAAADPTFNKAYSIAGSAFPADWPILLHSTPRVMSAGNATVAVASSNPHVVHSVMTDGPDLCFGFTVPNDALALSAQLYCDGYLLSTGNWTINGNRFLVITSTDGEVHRYDLITSAVTASCFTKNPYRAWKPPVETVKFAYMGDSYTKGTASYNAIYPKLMRRLGVLDYTSDSVNGTGYLSGGANNYLARSANSVRFGDPDVLIVHGGGAHDRFSAYSVSDIVTQAAKTLRNLAARFPDAKIVFVEGFAPPTGFSAFNPDYVNIRKQLQAKLTDCGIYFIDVATSTPWIYGTGKVGATTGDGNADVYIGADGVHPSSAGDDFISGRLEEPLRKICLDTGELAGRLVA